MNLDRERVEIESDSSLTLISLSSRIDTEKSKVRVAMPTFSLRPRQGLIPQKKSETTDRQNDRKRKELIW